MCGAETISLWCVAHLKGFVLYIISCVNNLHQHAGIKKKLSRISTTIDCAIIAERTKSITNHLYWYAASATDGDDNDIVKQ